MEPTHGHADPKKISAILQQLVFARHRTQRAESLTNAADDGAAPPVSYSDLSPHEKEILQVALHHALESSVRKASEG